MRGLALAILFSIPTLASAAPVSPECSSQQIEVSNQMKIIARTARELIYKQIAHLQDHSRPSDIEDIRGKCNRFKNAVDNWEHAEGASDKVLWQKAIAAEKDFARFMQSLILRDRAGWDKGMKEMEALGFRGKLNASSFSLALTRDLTGGNPELGTQRLEVALDFCSTEADDTGLGVMKTKVVVSEKTHGAKTLALDPMDYARANLSKDCGGQSPLETAFLALRGALRPASLTSAEKQVPDLKTGAEGFRD